MKENVFNKEKFIEDVKENVKNLYRKNIRGSFTAGNFSGGFLHGKRCDH